MTAKQYLLQYRFAFAELKCKEAERQSLFDRATNISPAITGGSPSPGNVTDKTGRGAVNIAALDERIAAEQQQLQDTLDDIRDSISRLPDTMERNLLTYYYVCGYTWEQTAVEMNYSYVHVVNNLHPAALKSITGVMKQKGIID